MCIPEAEVEVIFGDRWIIDHLVGVEGLLIQTFDQGRNRISCSLEEGLDIRFIHRERLVLEGVHRATHTRTHACTYTHTHRMEVS